MVTVKCPRCGSMVQKPATGNPVCNSCGFGSPGGAPAQAAHASHVGHMGQGDNKGMSIGSMVTGIIAAVMLCIPGVGGLIGLVLAIIAVVLGGLALSKMKRDPTVGGKGMAITGLVLGIVVLGLAIMVIILFASLLAALTGAAA